jgi:hypothetical protein
MPSRNRNLDTCSSINPASNLAEKLIFDLVSRKHDIGGLGQIPLSIG